MMTPSTVSKLIARLEARIGVRLIERSTRRLARLALTSEGQFYYERSRSLVAQPAKRFTSPTNFSPSARWTS